MKYLNIAAFLFCTSTLFAQNPLAIPPVLTGTTFNLNVQNGVTQFWSGINTNTYGINGNILAPTIMVNKGDNITLNVTNSLTGSGNSTTMHWHGLHVAPQHDGGPHQIINQGTTWSPNFDVMNDAATFWYHPHGDNKTDRHVSKGIAGFFIVKDAQEAALNLPRTYGVDDIPLAIQTKEFDVLNQIAIATFMDTVVMVNATINPYQNLPAQVVRLRLLNGASQRTFQIGFSNNMNFSLIGNDGGLLDAPQTMNRILLSNGERVEILVDLSAYQNDTIYLKCFGSELPKGVYGADSVGDAGVNQIMDYYNNSLNGTDFNLLEVRVTSPTANPITSIPTTLGTLSPLLPDANTVYRTFEIDTIGGMGITPNFAMGPFAFNGKLFHMDSINEYVLLNRKEVWTIHNKSMIAHPFHIHDVHFYILDINGVAPPAYEKGKKDVVLIMPGDSVRFITEFKDFANDSVPYMYHCHILHHEDDGMMGSFLVTQFPLSTNPTLTHQHTRIYPNPSHNFWTIQNEDDENIVSYLLYDVVGRLIEEKTINQSQFMIDNSALGAGSYFLTLVFREGSQTFKMNKEWD
ncbi:MAG: multicopper oxidase domain-containing protein [Chitinophagaceae bacterium]|nr:multicopper oxidase domain-containing protein [Chitinophagaceae bacterium]